MSGLSLSTGVSIDYFTALGFGLASTVADVFFVGLVFGLASFCRFRVFGAVCVLTALAGAAFFSIAFGVELGGGLPLLKNPESFLG